MLRALQPIPNMIYYQLSHSSRHRYSQFLTAQVIDRDGQPIKSTKSSFSHFLSCLEWVPAYRPMEGEQRERKYLRPNSVYLTSPEITSLLGIHVCYVDIDPSEFSRALGKMYILSMVEIAHDWLSYNNPKTDHLTFCVSAPLLGMRQSISVDILINYLKEWCVKPQADDQEQSLPEDELEGANFTSTVEHIHNIYTYLDMKCPPSSLRELFRHTPAVFIEYKR